VCVTSRASQWKWQFLTPYRINTPSTNHQKMSQVIISATLTDTPNLVHIRPRRASGRMGEILPNLFMPLFGNSPTGQTRRRIFARDGSNDADLRKDVPCGFRWYGSPFRGSNPPPKNFGGVNRRFQTKLTKSKNMLSLLWLSVVCACQVITQDFI